MGCPFPSLLRRRQTSDSLHCDIKLGANNQVADLQIVMLRGANILITGSSRGLGLEMVRQLVARGDTNKIVATCRDPAGCPALLELDASSDKVHVLRLDVTRTNSFPVLADNFKRITEGRGLNILINNAGVSPKSTKVNLVTEEQMRNTFECNVIAPLFLTKSLLPELKQAAKVSGNPALIVNLSSILGSIAENTKQGGLYPYRASKSALNAVTRSLSLDLANDKVEAVAIHPGWVRTDMGGQHAPLSPEQSVAGVLAQINGHTSDNNGGFIDQEGKTLPW